MSEHRATSAPPGACVLVTAAGTSTGYGMLRTLRDRWGASVRLVAADINPPELVAASALVDDYLVLPPIANLAFASTLIDGLRTMRATVYWPVLDAEIHLAAQLREQGRLPSRLRVLAPPSETALLCLDKLALSHRLSQVGLPTPATSALADADWLEAGLVMKPRRGVGSIGVIVCQSRNDWEAARRTADTDTIVQARCIGPEVTVDAHRLDNGAARAICRERLEVKAGVSTKVRVHEDAELSRLATALAAELGLTGTFCFQVMRDAVDGRWRITDVNPRPGGGTRMSVAAGVDVLGAAIAEAWGQDRSRLMPILGSDRIVVRHWEEDVR